MTEHPVSDTLEDMTGRDPSKPVAPVPPARAAARRLVGEMAGQGWLEELMTRSDDQDVQLTEVGLVPLDMTRGGASTFTPRPVPKGTRRLGGRSDMLISLDAGGMTVRDIGHHLGRHHLDATGREGLL